MEIIKINNNLIKTLNKYQNQIKLVKDKKENLNYYQNNNNQQI